MSYTPESPAPKRERSLSPMPTMAAKKEKGGKRESRESRSPNLAYRRSRSGCYTCRLRRKKCDEEAPVCKACKNLKVTCEYKRPMWWGNSDQRRREKEVIKNFIKNTKLDEKARARQAQSTSRNRARRTYSSPGLPRPLSSSDCHADCHADPSKTRAGSAESRYSLEYDFNRTPLQNPYDPFASQLQTPHFVHGAGAHAFPPYEVDIRTERQMFVNDMPTRRDSTISTFSTFQPPPQHASLSTYPGEDWIHEDYFETKRESLDIDDVIDPNIFDWQSDPYAAQSAMIHVEDCDRRLLDHFIDKVLRLIFPVLEVMQHGTVRSEVILPALESNKCYLHCCLSIAAMHLKATEGLSGEQIDNDILRHRFETVSELSKALLRDSDHHQILEATLGMIFFQCTVGRPDDSLPDVPWHSHFQAASESITKLDLSRVMLEADLSGAKRPFNMSLACWIDILGATMRGSRPQFADVHRTKHLAGASSGLRELMGCEDRVMYLISEIACLDSHKGEGIVDDLELCSHITALAGQLDHTETHEPLTYACTATGAIRPRQLSKNMTALFRIAARVYLCTLVPGYERHQTSTVNLIARFAEVLNLIPSGPDGFDRSLVWPMLICGAFSVPYSPYRAVFNNRIELLGEQAQYGSFGRMVRLIYQVWHLADGQDSTLASIPTTAEGSAGSPFLPTPTSVATTPGDHRQMVKVEEEDKMIPTRQNIHWRDVMQQNGWDVLLI